jgi:hypothetical protein
MNRRFGGTNHLLLYCRKSAEKEPSMLGHWFLALLIFDPEDGGCAFLRNVGLHTDYTAQYSGDDNFHNYRCDNLKSQALFGFRRLQFIKIVCLNAE